MPSYATKEKIEYRDIVIELIREISKKALVEFKGGYWKKEVKGNVLDEIYIPDSRKEYIQGIEFLSDLLLPSFDKKMINHYEEIMEEVDKILKEYEENKLKSEEYVIKKTRLMRRLFQVLMIFLNRIKYFKKKITFG